MREEIGRRGVPVKQCWIYTAPACQAHFLYVDLRIGICGLAEIKLTPPFIPGRAVWQREPPFESCRSLGMG